MPRVIRILPLLALFIALPSAAFAQAASPTIDVLYIKGTINPVLVDYIERGIEQAEEESATAVIIQMDTPGGLGNSMLEIVEEILSARVPVVVYVSPAGAQAASAGVFITMAAHVAVMAPATNIGAAHPVAIGAEGEVGMSEAMEEKVVNTAASKIRGIAVLRGRNMEWAEKAVRESVSATEQEALELNVIDLIATDLDDLISQLDGWQVTMLDGSVVTLQTKGASVKDIKMNAIEGFLFAISDPDIAYILLSLAILGITVEIFNPGLIFPGVVGAIAGLLAFYSLGMLPVNLAGILLMALAFGLFIAEAFTQTFGLLTAGGIVSLVVGSLILFKGGPLFQVNPAIITTVAIIITAILAFVINRVLVAHRRRATTGREELTGKTAVVRTALKPEGTVFHEGEIWLAVLDKGQAEAGEEVIITGFEGLKLYVTKKNKGGD